MIANTIMIIKYSNNDPHDYIVYIVKMTIFNSIAINIDAASSFDKTMIKRKR